MGKIIIGPSAVYFEDYRDAEHALANKNPYTLITHHDGQTMPHGGDPIELNLGPAHLAHFLGWCANDGDCMIEVRHGRAGSPMRDVSVWESPDGAEHCVMHAPQRYGEAMGRAADIIAEHDLLTYWRQPGKAGLASDLARAFAAARAAS